MKFKDLAIGEGFDWISPKIAQISFFARCWRNTYRGYVDEYGVQHTVGSMTVEVYHADSQGGGEKNVV